MWQVNVCEYAGNGWFKHFLPSCYPVSRDMVEKRIITGIYRQDRNSRLTNSFIDLY